MVLELFRMPGNAKKTTHTIFVGHLEKVALVHRFGLLVIESPDKPNWWIGAFIQFPTDAVTYQREKTPNPESKTEPRDLF